MRKSFKAYIKFLNTIFSFLLFFVCLLWLVLFWRLKISKFFFWYNSNALQSIPTGQGTLCHNVSQHNERDMLWLIDWICTDRETESGQVWVTYKRPLSKWRNLCSSSGGPGPFIQWLCCLWVETPYMNKRRNLENTAQKRLLQRQSWNPGPQALPATAACLPLCKYGPASRANSSSISGCFGQEC